MGEEATFPGEDGRQLKDNIQCLTGVEETGGKMEKIIKLSILLQCTLLI